MQLSEDEIISKIMLTTVDTAHEIPYFHMNMNGVVFPVDIT